MQIELSQVEKKMTFIRSLQGLLNPLIETSENVLTTLLSMEREMESWERSLEGRDTMDQFYVNACTKKSLGLKHSLTRLKKQLHEDIYWASMDVKSLSVKENPPSMPSSSQEEPSA